MQKGISKISGVNHIMSTFPKAKYDSRLLLLAYWQIFDGIEIPQELMQQIIAKGSHPETVMRRRREILEAISISNSTQTSEELGG
jgi:hypothetical protein